MADAEKAQQQAQKFPAKYPVANAIGSAPITVASGLKNLPSAVFDSNDASDATEDDKPNAFQRYIEERPANIADGLVKGVLSVGNGIFQGLTGVFVEPVKGAQKSGAVGFAKGVGKGLTGLIFQPVAGVIELAGKTTQGAINTPFTVYDAIKGDDDDDDAAADRAIKAANTNTYLSNTQPIVGNVFGAKIEDAAAFAESRGGHRLAALEIVKYLMDHVNEEGIFRLSGRVGTIRELKAQFNSGAIFTIPDDPEACGVHEATSLLKGYLAELPEPLLTTEGCVTLLSIYSSADKSSRISGYKAVLDRLPHYNKVLLKQIMLLLQAVRKSGTSKMDASNLGSMFGPNLMARADTNLQDILKCNSIVSEIITNSDLLFTD